MLKDLIKAFQMIDEHNHLKFYLDQQTGEILHFNADVMWDFDEAGHNPALISEKLRPLYQKYLEIKSFSPRYLPLPRINEEKRAGMIRQFINQISNPRVYTDLSDAFTGYQAFHDFKQAVRHNKMQKSWDNFREEQLKKIAITWCKKNKLQWK